DDLRKREDAVAGQQPVEVVPRRLAPVGDVDAVDAAGRGFEPVLDVERVDEDSERRRTSLVQQSYRVRDRVDERECVALRGVDRLERDAHTRFLACRGDAAYAFENPRL